MFNDTHITNELYNSFNYDLVSQIEDPLATAGALLQFGVSFIPEGGSVLSFIIGLLWPTNSVDTWTSIKQQVKELVDEEIAANNWQLCQNKINEMKDKVSAYAHYINTKKSDLAKNMYTFLSNYFTGIEELFNIKGKHIAHAYAPFIASIVTIKVIFFVTSISNAQFLKLSKNELNNSLKNIKDTVTIGKNYIAELEKDLIHYMNAIKDVNKLFSVYNYYYKNAIFFSKMWSTKYEDYLNNNIKVNGFYIPLVAAGIFYELSPKSNDPEVITLNASQILGLCLAPVSNIPVGNKLPQYNGPGKTQTSQLKKLTFTHTKDLEERYVKLCGADLTYEDGNIIQVGMIDGNQLFPNFHVASKTIELLKNNIKLIKVELIHQGLVSTIILTSDKGEVFRVGHIKAGGDISVTGSTNSLLYTINSVYVSSDYAGYIKGNGHQSSGVSVAAMYNNSSAQDFIQQQLKQFILNT